MSHEQGHKDVVSVGLGIDAKKIKIDRNKFIKVDINDLKTELYTFLVKRRKLNSLVESHAFLGFSQALPYPESRIEMEIDGK